MKIVHSTFLLVLLAFLTLGWTPEIANAQSDTIDVGCTGNSTVNGQNFRNSLASAMAGSLIRLGPCTFDLGSNTLWLRNTIDIQGSGRSSTTLKSSAGVAINVPVGVRAEMSNLALETRWHGTTAGYGISIKSSLFLLTEIAIRADSSFGSYFAVVNTDPTSPRLDRIFVSVTSGGAAWGFYLRGSAVLTNSFVNAKGSANSHGLAMTGSGRVIAQNVTVDIESTASNGYGFVVFEGEATLRQCQADVLGERLATGITVYSAREVAIEDSNLQARGFGRVNGLDVGGTELRLSRSTFSADSLVPAADRSSAILIRSGLTVVADQSIFEGFEAVEALSNSTARFGSSRLSGALDIRSGASVKCAASYDGNFNTLQSHCRP